MIYLVVSFTQYDKNPDNCKYPFATIEATQNKKQTNTGGLAKFLKLIFGAKVMLTVTLDTKDCILILNLL